ncbi:hypothetical protein RYX36_004063, partial [Vicia faba]
MLPKDSSTGNSLTTTSCNSRGWSQKSSSSHMSITKKFLDEYIQIKFNEISQLAEPMFCVTVATTDKLLESGHDWCYIACHQCPRVAKGEIPPFFCSVGHRIEAEIRRFKIFVEVVHEGNTAKFLFWNQEATELLDTTAAQTRATMIHDGITDSLEFPLALDVMLGKKFAFKVKWDPKWKSSSIVQFIKDNHLITILEGPLAINQ